MISTDNVKKASQQVQNALQSASIPGETNVHPLERWASGLVGGGLLIFGIGRDIARKQVSPVGVVLSLLGGMLAYRSATGHDYVYQALGISTSTSEEGRPTEHFEKAMTINRSQEDMYHFWDDFDNANSGQPLTSNQDASTREQQLEAWNALKATAKANRGAIQFEHAPDGRGTVVRVTINYTQPPAGKAGKMVTAIARKSPVQAVTEDLRHFKEAMEAGEIPTVQGQPQGPR